MKPAEAALRESLAPRTSQRVRARLRHPLLRGRFFHAGRRAARARRRVYDRVTVPWKCARLSNSHRLSHQAQTLREREFFETPNSRTRPKPRGPWLLFPPPITEGETELYQTDRYISAGTKPCRTA